MTQEYITENIRSTRELGNPPRFKNIPDGSVIDTISVVVGSLDTFVFPRVVDENVGKVTFTIDYGGNPYVTELIKWNKYKVDPPENTCTSSYTFTIKMTDRESKSSTYYYTIIYTNSAPDFETVPSSTTFCSV